MLQKEKQNRKDNEFNDYGYVFRGQHENPEPISKNMISRWCGTIGEIIGVKNLKKFEKKSKNKQIPKKKNPISNFMVIDILEK